MRVDMTDGTQTVTVDEAHVGYLESLGWRRVTPPAEPSKPKRRTRK